MADCRSCGRQVVWCRTENGGRLAIAVDEDPVGDLIPYGSTAKGEMVLRRVEHGAGRYVAHMPQTCEKYLRSIESENGDEHDG